MTTEERYKEALRNIMARSYGQITPILREIFITAQKSLNPPPQFEEVEVKQWGIFTVSGTMAGIYENEYDAIDSLKIHNLCSVVQLTGTYQRPIPQKIKRREELRITAMTCDKVKAEFDKPQNILNGRLFYEWEE